MRIAVCGPNKKSVILRVEESLNAQVKHPWSINGESTIIDIAAETYKYFDETNVIFDGSAFDYLGKENDEGYNDVYEQIALNTLVNLDYICVITLDMDKNTLKMYDEYSKLYPGKFYFYTSDTDFEIVMK